MNIHIVVFCNSAIRDDDCIIVINIYLFIYFIKSLSGSLLVHFRWNLQHTSRLIYLNRWRIAGDTAQGNWLD